MHRFLLISAALFLPAAVSAQCSSTVASSGSYGTAQGASGNAQYVVFMPQPATCFNGDVILFAHGYIGQGSPADAWQGQLALTGGTSLPALVNSFGFGFAASGFSKQGLAILQGEQDTAALTNVIQGLNIPVRKYFVAGASEGGLITAKLIEDNPLFKGGVAVCGPIGDFQKQINYFGDARILFDYFFPGVLSAAGGNAVNIPTELMTNWATKYEPAVIAALQANPRTTFQLIRTGNIAIGRNPSNAIPSIVAALWYNVFATNDAVSMVGGNPFDNIGRVYRGSYNDAHLNAAVARFAATASRPEMLKYETTGVLPNPLVTLHTIADPVIPYWHEALYAAKVESAGRSSELTQLPSYHYGHCAISETDAEAALLALLLKAGL
jgi:hypothetical protein